MKGAGFRHRTVLHGFDIPVRHSDIRHPQHLTFLSRFNYHDSSAVITTCISSRKEYTMLLNITDDFDLDKIIDSGQCFRAAKIRPQRYRFITGDSVLYLTQQNAVNYEASCSPEEWNTIWSPYFDRSRNYTAIRQALASDDAFRKECLRYGKGLRILRQDPWETLVTFIISQRKSIPAIRQCVELLSQRYGHPITTEFETVFSFPTLKELKSASEADLLECKTGYRAPYIAAVTSTLEGMDLREADTLSNQDLLTWLTSLKGVGIKVANCVALFAYGRVDLCPVDTWIQKVIHKYGDAMFREHPEYAGILQQYIFYYVLHCKEWSEHETPR